MSVADLSFLIGAALFVSLNALASGHIEPEDGWSSWKIEVPSGTRTWCCVAGQDWRSPGRQCDLDSRWLSVTNFAADDAARVYVRIEKGVLRDVRVYADACPVRSREAIVDLGVRNGDDSLRFVAAAKLDSDRLYPAIVAHGSDEAADELKSRAEQSRGEARELAWFWISQLARPSAEAVLLGALNRGDSDSEPLVFALSQLPGERSAGALLKVLKSPKRDIETRKRALFWLGQSDDPRAQEEIAAILD